jgi:uncharacterized protein
MRIGVISDTHGLVRPEVYEAFANVDHILHAGDIGGTEVLDELRTIAPVTACAGNVDGFHCGDARETARVTLGGLRFLLMHILDYRRVSDADVVVFGHSHQQHNERDGAVWYFNPASAGPRRFHLPVSVGLFEKTHGKWTARHVELVSSR